jgi:hypothetical protein
VGVSKSVVASSAAFASAAVASKARIMRDDDPQTLSIEMVDDESKPQTSNLNTLLDKLEMPVHRRRRDGIGVPVFVAGPEVEEPELAAEVTSTSEAALAAAPDAIEEFASPVQEEPEPQPQPEDAIVVAADDTVESAGVDAEPSTECEPESVNETGSEPKPGALQLWRQIFGRQPRPPAFTWPEEHQFPPDPRLEITAVAPEPAPVPQSTAQAETAAAAPEPESAAPAKEMLDLAVEGGIISPDPATAYRQGFAKGQQSASAVKIERCPHCGCDTRLPSHAEQVHMLRQIHYGRAPIYHWSEAEFQRLLEILDEHPGSFLDGIKPGGGVMYSTARIVLSDLSVLDVGRDQLREASVHG